MTQPMWCRVSAGCVSTGRVRCATVVSILGVAIFGLAPQAQAQAEVKSVQDFFAGKQVSVLVGHDAGGGYDIYSRVLARHMGNHLPGHPSFVVKNMVGAGGLRLAGHLANGAPRDGTTFGLFDRGGVIEPLLGNPGARFDARELSPIGSIGKQVATCAAYYKAPVQTIQQALQQDLLVGSTGPSATSTYPALLNDVIKTKFKIIQGYQGSAQILLAMERGEVQGVCLSWPTLKAAKPDWVAEKKLVPLLQISFTSHPELDGVPMLRDVTKGDEETRMLEFFFAPNEFGRPYFGPPDVPAERLTALRRAFDATMKDPEFLADAEQAKMELDPITGEDMEKLIAGIYDTPKPLIDRVAAAMAPFREK